MRVVYAYGILAGGGCERRTGQLMRWLLDRGEDAWLVCSGWFESGLTMMFQQCQVPQDRVIIMPPEQSYAEFLTWTLEALKADVVDVQWGGCLPAVKVCPVVYTMHGVVQAVPMTMPLDAIICVEALPPDHVAYHHRTARIAVIFNWVDLPRFPFQEKLGEGACYFGRAFKAINAVKVCTLRPDVTIDAWGTGEVETVAAWPPNLRWQGYGFPEEFIYRYRVVFAAAQAAKEALAAGRLVIVGGWRNYDGRATYGHLARPPLLEAMSQGQFTVQPSVVDVEPDAGEVLRDFVDAMEDDMTEMRYACRAYIEREHHPEVQMSKIYAIYKEVTTCL